MARCKWCNDGGLFTSLDKDGLCKNCEFIIHSEAVSRLRVIQDSTDLIEKSKNIDTIKSRLGVALDYVFYFSKYEEKGINVFGSSEDGHNITLSSIANGIKEDTNKRIAELVKDDLVDILAKMDSYKSKALLDKYYQKVKDEIVEVIAVCSPDVANYEEALGVILEVRNQIDLKKESISFS